VVIRFCLDGIPLSGGTIDEDAGNGAASHAPTDRMCAGPQKA
jgi:hypothetical protein